MERFERKPAFTLLELTIALTVSLILVGIALPRYNDLLRQEEFTTELQKVASCVQQAQSLAAAPRADLLTPNTAGAVSARWVAAEVAPVDASGNQTCSVVAIDASTTLSNLLLATPVNQLANPLVTSGIAQLTLPAFRMYFGVLEKGMPVKYIDASTQVTSADPNIGMQQSILATSANDATLTAHLVVEQGGAPIHIVKP